MNFVAIDVETANSDMASICQIGLVRYEDRALADEWTTLVDPEDDFDGINISIHGIDESAVKDAPKFPELADMLRSRLVGRVVVCHTHFDRVAIHRVSHKYGINAPECTWLDSARIARRTWAECANRGYGLSAVCRMLGYEFKHHDALEDAKAAAHILLSASSEKGFDIDGWLKRVRQPIDSSCGSGSFGHSVKREGNPEGPLYGEVLVFTGTLGRPRAEAAGLATAIGCEVEPRVTHKTTILVVGDQDAKKLAGQEKSGKHRKAEELIEKGVSIRILKESDFEELARLADEFA